MALRLRGFALLLAVGCTAPEKIAPQRFNPSLLPKPDLSASPTGMTKPANPPVDNRGQTRQSTPALPALDTPVPGQNPATSMPVVGGNPAVIVPIPSGTPVSGRGSSSGVNPIYTPADIPKLAEPAPLGKPIEVIPLPTPQPSK